MRAWDLGDLGGVDVGDGAGDAAGDAVTEGPGVVDAVELGGPIFSLIGREPAALLEGLDSLIAGGEAAEPAPPDFVAADDGTGDDRRRVGDEAGLRAGDD